MSLKNYNGQPKTEMLFRQNTVVFHFSIQQIINNRMQILAIVILKLMDFITYFSRKQFTLEQENP